MLSLLKLSLVTIIVIKHTFGQGKQESMRLLVSRLVYDDISRHVPPGLNDESPLEIYVSFTGTALTGLNIKQQTMKLNGVLTLAWNDERLAWNPSSYSNITKMTVPQAIIWKPDLSLFNVQTDDFESSLGNDDLPLTIYTNGSVVWDIGFSENFICRADATKYPFDTNTCPIDITPWVSNINNLVLKTDSIDTLNLAQNSEFEISVEKVDIILVSIPESSYNNMSIHIKLVRRPLFIVITLLLPISLLSVLCSFSFLLSPDQSDKLTLAITTLLSITVFMGVMDNTLPKSSDTIPALAIYVCLVACHAFLTVVGNVVVLHRIQSEHKGFGSPTKPQHVATVCLPQSSANQNDQTTTRPVDHAHSVTQIGHGDHMQSKSKDVNFDQMNNHFFFFSLSSSLTFCIGFWIFVLI